MDALPQPPTCDFICMHTKFFSVFLLHRRQCRRAFVVLVFCKPIHVSPINTIGAIERFWVGFQLYVDITQIKFIGEDNYVRRFLISRVRSASDL